MKSLVLLAAIIGCAFAQTQNLCGTRTDVNEIVFTNDPAECESYLWCNFNDQHELISVHQGRCPTGFKFNQDARACDAQFECATEVCRAVDVEPEAALRVAVSTDPSCRQFFFCRLGEQDTTTITCSETLVFNRNFGFCTSAAEAPCSGAGGGNPPPATCTETGFFDNSNANQNCADFFVCDDNKVRTDLSCNAPRHFNPATGGCEAPEKRDPICPFPASPPTVTGFGPHIPTPPLINVPKSFESQLRERFAERFRML